MTILRRFVVLAVLLVVALPLRAEENGLDRFVGQWEGSGVTEKFSEEGYFTYTKRDLNVAFAETEKGFDITWITGFRVEGDSGPVVLRKTTTLNFVEIAPGVYETAESPPWKRAHRWARLSEGTLIIYIFEVDEAGLYEISRYVRTVSDDGVMQLGFSRDMDGRPVRQVTGTLTRTDG